MTMAGLSGLVAAQLVHRNIVSFPWRFSVRCSWPLPIGILFALPALRTRGVNLAVVTLGFSILVYDGIMTNQSYTGGADGIS